MKDLKVVKDALIKKFEGASNKELMDEYGNYFKHVPEMYSQFKGYLFALAKTYPQETLSMLKRDDPIVLRSVARGLAVDNLKRFSVALDVLLGMKYEEVAEKYSVSIARTRGIFMEVVTEINLGIPEYYGKKQIIAEYADNIENFLKQKIEMLSEN